MRCSANGASLRLKLHFHPKRFRKRNLHLITACGRSCLAAARVSSSSASGTAVLGLPRRPIHCRAPASQPSKGKPKRNRAARLAEQTRFAPNTETFSAVYNISVGCRSRLARSPGGLGGRSRIEFIVSPLLRRRHNESHFAAQPTERSFFFPLFLSPRKKKRL